MELPRKKSGPKVSLSHPFLALIVSAISLAGSLFSAACIAMLGETARVRLLLDTSINGSNLDLAVVRLVTKSFALPWLSAFVGIVIGVPFFLVGKRIIGVHPGVFAALDSMPLRARLRLPVLTVTASLTAITVLPVLVAGVIAWHVGIAVVPACLAAFVPYGLQYPELQRVYDLIVAKQ